MRTAIATLYGECMYNFSGTDKLSSKWPHHFAFPPGINGSSCCSTSPLLFGVDKCFRFWPFKWVMVLQCYFNLQFPNNTTLNICMYILVAIYLLWWAISSGILDIFNCGCLFCYCWVSKVYSFMFYIQVSGPFWVKFCQHKICV